jgi:hypothetical protein
MRGMRGYRIWFVWGVLVLLTTTTPAWGFYWVGWPGSQLSPAPSLLPPTTVGSANLPVNTQPTPMANSLNTSNEGLPAQGPPTPGQSPSAPGGSSTPSPERFPEPATGLIGLIGLGAVAIGRRIQRAVR